MADLPIDPFALLDRSQRIALGGAGEAFDALLAVGRTATQPEEAVRQLSTLVAAVGDLVSASVQPLQEVIVRQREVAETMASLATAQSELPRSSTRSRRSTRRSSSPWSPSARRSSASS